MKKWAVLVLLFFLSGCSGVPEEMETAMELRSRLLQSSGCSFTAKITGDYGDKVHTFLMECQADAKGDISFTVTEPATISGITGKLSGKEGALTFGDTALCFELLADGQLSPVSAPWVLMNTLRSGAITAVGREDKELRLSVDDSYEDDPLRLDIWLDGDNLPKTADIFYDGRRILSVSLDTFRIL